MRHVTWIDPAAHAAWPPAVGACATSAHAQQTAPFDLGGQADPERIDLHRRMLAQALGLERVQYLEQVHGTDVVRLDEHACARPPRADAAVTRTPGLAVAILTADCLPVLFAHRDGRCVGAAHAGWRGLAGGVLEATVAAMVDTIDAPPEAFVAWLGPAIGADAFEIGPEVREALRRPSPDARVAAAFDACMRRGRGDRWHADLAGLARARLERAGVGRVLASAVDVSADDGCFFSYRRDAGRTGRHASLVWIDPGLP